MRTTVSLDDDLVKTASKWTGIKSTSALVNFALKDFIEGEASRRLAEMGGSDPDMKYTERGPRSRREPLDQPIDRPDAE
jgi:Arc/MetJ family transcription regulator